MKHVTVGSQYLRVETETGNGDSILQKSSWAEVLEVPDMPSVGVRQEWNIETGLKRSYQMLKDIPC